MTEKHEERTADATMPEDVSNHVGLFDRFATKASEFAARAPFFLLCILLVLIWAPSIIWLPMETWQLIINTTTTIITFLMVALLQNTESRNDAAIQQKLNAIANGLADLMQHTAKEDPDSTDLDECRDQLRRAVGLEDDEST
ncbi:low affinity iron permease family protein [Glycomyces artemisiae]|uniref:Low affinity iron permease n=2 Tax=Glycomyces artemisiae TaxID=1076443 RepID=A0A2T0UH94_9ACTN|nr:low affinity iron permease family protein [Glycomyces artemisiae]PRY57305.1 low affinity iron permease [Glycomyces artemisiae]